MNRNHVWIWVLLIIAVAAAGVLCWYVIFTDAGGGDVISGTLVEGGITL